MMILHRFENKISHKILYSSFLHVFRFNPKERKKRKKGKVEASDRKGVLAMFEKIWRGIESVETRSSSDNYVSLMKLERSRKRGRFSRGLEKIH